MMTLWLGCRCLSGADASIAKRKSEQDANQ
jgi:hypothetical protein